MLNRRQLIAGTTAFAVGLNEAIAAEQADQTAERPLIVSTWPFGKPANEIALTTLQRGGSTLDAVEQGIRHTEASGNSSVGLSGHPNAAGYSQLDACVMHGPGHRAGAVAGIEGIVHPISAARRVMEKTPHVMLVGDGARVFALREGLESRNVDANGAKLEQWNEQRGTQTRSSVPSDDVNHDTITLLVLGADGTLSGGCSTSGLGNKLPGRVGDSPIIGSGLYVDNEVGAAGATGTGENVMRYCASFMVVEFMRQGLGPGEACRRTIDRIAAQDPLGRDLSINFVALDKQGRFGAAGTGKFPYSVTYPGFSEVMYTG